MQLGAVGTQRQLGKLWARGGVEGSTQEVRSGEASVWLNHACDIVELCFGNDGRLVRVRAVEGCMKYGRGVVVTVISVSGAQRTRRNGGLQNRRKSGLRC